MKHEEAVSFISKAITLGEPESWADLGCGAGTFTKALAELLPPGSHITAVDQESQKINVPWGDYIRADFEKDELKLAGLDGIMMANALHYVANKKTLLKNLKKLFKNEPKFLIVEYDTDTPNTWVPYPISFVKLKALVNELGYCEIKKVNTRPSVYHSGEMYCALISKN